MQEYNNGPQGEGPDNYGGGGNNGNNNGGMFPQFGPFPQFGGQQNQNQNRR